jgi:hypothetical protein
MERRRKQGGLVCNHKLGWHHADKAEQQTAQPNEIWTADHGGSAKPTQRSSLDWQPPSGKAHHIASLTMVVTMIIARSRQTSFSWHWKKCL